MLEASDFEKAGNWFRKLSSFSASNKQKNLFVRLKDLLLKIRRNIFPANLVRFQRIVERIESKGMCLLLA